MIVTAFEDGKPSWRYLSTATVTHSLLMALHHALDISLTRRSPFKVSATRAILRNSAQFYAIILTPHSPFKVFSMLCEIIAFLAMPPLPRRIRLRHLRNPVAGDSRGARGRRRERRRAGLGRRRVGHRARVSVGRSRRVLGVGAARAVGLRDRGGPVLLAAVLDESAVVALRPRQGPLHRWAGRRRPRARDAGHLLVVLARGDRAKISLEYVA